MPMIRSVPRLSGALVAILLAVLLPGSVPAAAQTVVGSITEEGTARPMAGVFIVLVDEQGRRGNGVLSGETGGYVLRARAPGRYRLHAELIGYATTQSDWIDVPAGSSVRRDLEISVEAVSLDAIQVETGQRCRRSPGSGPETARLWEEARKALEIAHWSEGQGILRFRVVKHRRELDASSLQVTAQREEPRSGYYDRSPYRSIPAERLAQGGYIQLAPDETWDYYAPDAEVLLSETFLENHCFRVEGPPRDEPDLIGLAFEPVPERTLPDISGVLWLDRGSAELKRLDYQYRNLPFEHGRWPQVGGRVEFDRLATGMWIVRRWHIRMPLAARQTGGFGGGAREIELVTLSEEGAEVSSVTTRDGRRIAAAAGATLYGTVTAENGGLDPGLSGARIEVLATEHSTTTGDEGGFRLTGLAAGTWGVRITHPELERIGIGPIERTVELQAGRATRVVIGASLTADRAREMCTEGGWSAAANDVALVYGTVHGPDGDTPVPGALVHVWSGDAQRRTVADSTGAFRFCVDAGSGTLSLYAAEPSVVVTSRSLLDVVEVDVSSPGFISARVPLSRHSTLLAAAPAQAAERAGWSNAIVGRVLEEGTKRPVDGAMVTLSSGGEIVSSMVTDGAGAFRLMHPDSRQTDFVLRVEHIAYGASESEVTFRPAEEIHMDVVVSARAIELDPIVVTERRLDFLAAQGFYDRLSRGAGLFVEREEIERRRPTKITDLLQGRSGLDVVGVAGGYDVRLTHQISFNTNRLSCQPSIFLDGSMLRLGGAPAGNGPIDPKNPDTRPTGGGPTEILLSDVVSPDDVEAIEVYKGPAGMPQQFGGTISPCGAVVIWTRRGQPGT